MTTDDVFKGGLTCWKGKPVDRMTAAELLTVLNEVIAHYETRILNLKSERSEWHATGQPVPYTPADGQW